MTGEREAERGEKEFERQEEKQSLKRYMASGSHCPIGFHLVIGCRDGAAAPVGADDLWYHTGQSWVYVSTFLRFSVSTFLRFSVN